ncbi:class I SAM-dependent RNA methyltransferase [Nitriliruptor alkaliphilus]|uniref:class I SAM-dependent RNA methyltransferase n=1 Tax=Nitriliruptor alkaliphilus TaxID=427918 RepID=UPI000695FDFF|nr:class I SAM-dependent RNA methyltransferase [Nitriliruptor alkaliphilus]
MSKRRRERNQNPLPRGPLKARVDGFTHGGEGVVRIEGKAVFVPGTLPGEQVVVQVTDDRARWARATLVEVVEGSADRVAPPLTDPDAIGGGDLAHAAPDAQRRLKTRVVREQLERLGRVAAPPVADCLAVGPDLRYRTHVRLHADPDGRLGFHRAGSHEVIPVDDLVLATPQVQAVRDAVGDATGAAEVAFRAHASTGTAAAAITPGPGGLAIPEGDFDVVLVQPNGSQLALRGDGVLAETVAGLTYRFDTSSFFQVSTGGAEALVEHVLRAAGRVDGALLWDLYAGVGLLSLPLARAGAEVVAVEGHAAATRWAERNADEAGLDIAVEHAPVASFVTDGGTSHDPPDVVVLDPPRTGAGADVIAGAISLGPGAIVYVACDVAALARDTRALIEGGYRLTAVQPLDLFPMTHHVEVVATFTR